MAHQLLAWSRRAVNCFAREKGKQMLVLEPCSERV